MRRPLLAELAAARRGVVAVAATYSFFLLWAQYGFLHLLRERLAGPAPLRLAMGAMGVAGLLASLAAARLLAPRRLASRRSAPHNPAPRHPAPHNPAPPHRAGRGSTPTADPARRLLVAGFLACAAVAPAALAARGAVALTLAAAAIGVATALVTVPLAADLRRLLPGERYGLAVGLGTGVAYLACNLPPLFAGTPAVQAVFVAAVCLAAASLTGRAPAPRTGHPEPPALLPRRAFRGAGFAAVVLAFLALVWLDSAAFAVIQETAPLKGASWAGAAHTLTQGAVHLLAAVAAGLALDAGGLMLLPPAAFLLFLVALPLLGGAPGAAGALLAAPLYAAGISLYSVALVAYPASRGDQAGLVPRRWRAGLLFGVAGWLGSALGVGMAQDLHRIPAAFLAAAAAVLAAALWLARGSRRGSTRAAAFPDGSAGVADDANGSAAEPAGGRARRVLRLVAAPVLFAAAGVAWAVVASPESGSLASLGPAAVEPVGGDSAGGDAAGGESAAIARGRRVYVGEGCVHCHSQYVRPASRDVVLWGPFRPLDRRQRPPLVGNRRQGPDLSNVGNRRSPEWQRLHLSTRGRWCRGRACRPTPTCSPPATGVAPTWWPTSGASAGVPAPSAGGRSRRGRQRRSRPARRAAAARSSPATAPPATAPRAAATARWRRRCGGARWTSPRARSWTSRGPRAAAPRRGRSSTASSTGWCASGSPGRRCPGTSG